MIELPVADKNQLKYLLNYINRGWAVFPCGGKIPKTKHGFKDATRSLEEAERIFIPGDNIGIATGQMSGIFVVDVDVKNGAKGLESLLELEDTYGKLTDTVEAITPSSGRHIYFRCPAGREIKSRNGFMPGIDIKADGGYVIAPLSMIEGRPYQWEKGCSPEDVEIAQAPGWLINLLLQHAQEQETRITLKDWGEEAKEGGRNNALTRMAGSLLAKGRMQPSDAFPMLLAWNETHCKPPLAIDEVQGILQSIAKAEQDQKNNKIKNENLTDLGNAERLIRLHGENLHYCPDLGKNIIWDGSRWRKDDTEEIERLAKDTVRNIYIEATELTDENQRKALVSHALRSESAAKISAMINLAQSEPGIPIRSQELDADQWLLNCRNMTIDLKTGKALEPKRADLITKQAGVNYIPGAKCPNFLEFLNLIFDGNPNLIEFIQKAVGYSMTGSTDERCLFICYGKGKNGKTTFVETVSELLGDYALRTPTQTLLSKRQDGIPNDIAALRGARFVFAAESKEGRCLSEELVKDLTGTDTISARFLRQEWFQFKPEFKLWLSTNHKPVIKGTDDAIWDRIRLIPFNVRIPDDKIRPAREIKEMFAAEMPGIFNYFLEGLTKWHSEGLIMAGEVKDATSAYRSEMDSLQEFIDDCCDTGDRFQVTVKDLYEAYTKWCEKNAEQPLKKRAFGGKFTERGYSQFQQSTGDRSKTWNGIALRTDC